MNIDNGYIIKMKGCDCLKEVLFNKNRIEVESDGQYISIVAPPFELEPGEEIYFDKRLPDTHENREKLLSDARMLSMKIDKKRNRSI